MTTIQIDELSPVHGGMSTEGFRRSPNVEDRRGLSLQESLAATSTPPPLPPVPFRFPGDLASQAGIDHLPVNFLRG